MFFISDALAQTAPAGSPGADAMLPQLGIMVVIFVVFYFLLIRPQTKRQKEHKSLIEGHETSGAQLLLKAVTVWGVKNSP